MQGRLSAELAEKWAYERERHGSDGNAPRMDGTPEELRDVVRSKLEGVTILSTVASVTHSFPRR